MRIVSVNVGMPREVKWRGDALRTGIFKTPAAGRVRVFRDHVDGDGQGNTRVHGGPDQAVYLYPADHYRFWRREIPGVDLPWGMFGENLTVEGLDETVVRIGDRFRCGSAELRATGPRMPCTRLNMRFGRDDMIGRFLDSERSGVYCAVEREGEVGAGDAVETVHREPHDVTVVDVVRALSSGAGDAALLRRVAAVAALPPAWKARVLERLEPQAKE